MMKPNGRMPVKLPHQATSLITEIKEIMPANRLKSILKILIFMSKISYSTQKYHFSLKSGIFFLRSCYLSCCLSVPPVISQVNIRPLLLNVDILFYQGVNVDIMGNKFL